MSSKQFADKLNKRRQELVLFIATLLWLIGAAGLLLSLANLIAPSRVDSLLSERLGSMVSTVVVFLVLSFIRFVLAKRRYRVALWIIVFFQTIISVFLMLRNGTTSIIPFVMVTAAVLCISIVISVRAALIYVAVYIATMLGIFLMHRTGQVAYTPGDTSSSPFTTIYLIVFLILYIAISKLAYGEIANAYQEAAQHAADLEVANTELEKLNTALEDKVEIRSKQLKESFQLQLETFYENAILGTISKSMVHDIATPLSTISGTLQLLQNDKAVSKYADLIGIANLSLHQIENIIENSRDLMRGQLPHRTFDPDSVLLAAVQLVRNRLNTEEIKLTTDLTSSITIFGPETIFERIVLNILNNAMDELSQFDQRLPRTISISSWIENGGYYFSIRDNGRGIHPDHLEQVFEPNFSQKVGDRHLGFGLAFVKEMWSRHFDGQINLRSELNQFTQFTLSTKLPAADANQGTKA